MDMLTRGEWGAQHDRGPAVAEAGWVYLHHSVTPPPAATRTAEIAAMRTLERIAWERFRTTVSYPFAIMPSGTIAEGCGPRVRGSHTRGHNTVASAIVLVGNYSDRRPTRRQVYRAALLLRHGAARNWWKSAQLAGGHRKLAGACPLGHEHAWTECPGDYGARAVPIINAEAQLDHDTIRRGSRGPDVRHAQLRLRAYGRTVDVDGVFGPKTERAVESVQRARKLRADGIVGPSTWLTLHS